MIKGQTLGCSHFISFLFFSFLLYLSGWKIVKYNNDKGYSVLAWNKPGDSGASRIGKSRFATFHNVPDIIVQVAALIFSSKLSAPRSQGNHKVHKFVWLVLSSVGISILSMFLPLFDMTKRDTF